MSQHKTFSRDEVRLHVNQDSLWCIIDATVYDMTDFQHTHPGGASVLRQVGGQDATQSFYSLHRHEILSSNTDLVLGTISGESPQIMSPNPGDLSLVPYAEPLWLAPHFTPSPYYNDTHYHFQRKIRLFSELEAAPILHNCEDEGLQIPQQHMTRLGSLGLFGTITGPGEHLRFTSVLEGVIEPDQFDMFHRLIQLQEAGRLFSPGSVEGSLGCVAISLPAFIAFFGDKARKQAIIQRVISGQKGMCLAITEAFAGSDVAGIQTRAEKTPDGKYYIVNGTKKWITGGHFSHYFLTAVRTGGKGAQGLSMLLIERGQGVETRPIQTAYSAAAGTAIVSFENAKVPVQNLLGQENMGFMIIVSNFTQERWVVAATWLGNCRAIIEECIKWSNQRLVFGKPLIDQPVIRQKLAKMIALIESHQAWIETLTHQICQMSHTEQSQTLTGPMALMKMSVGRAVQEIASEAVQIWGGRALTPSGPGKHIAYFNRANKFCAILGGSDEIMAELAIKQLMRGMPTSCRL